MVEWLCILSVRREENKLRGKTLGMTTWEFSTRFGWNYMKASSWGVARLNKSSNEFQEDSILPPLRSIQWSVLTRYPSRQLEFLDRQNSKAQNATYEMAKDNFHSRCSPHGIRALDRHSTREVSLDPTIITHLYSCYNSNNDLCRGRARICNANSTGGELNRSPPKCPPLSQTPSVYLI